MNNLFSSIKSVFKKNTDKNCYGFFAMFFRQSYIKRWSLMRCVQQENVLEHVAIVTFLSMIIGHIANNRGKNVNIQLMMQNSQIHDLDEVLTSDLVTPIKAQLGPAVKSLSETARRRLLNTVPEELLPEIIKSFEISGYEKDLVKAVDVYAAYIKAKTEIIANNAIEFQDAFDTLSAQLQEQKQKCPELVELDEMFTGAFSQSVDQLTRRMSLVNNA